MNQAWKNLQPKDTFIVTRKEWISDVDIKTLSYLYQPIIGINSFSLYHLFLSMLSEQEPQSYEQFHADVLNETDMDIPAFFQARSRLEGLGLLNVYEKKELQQRSFIYELQKPLDYHDFLKDDVMSMLLFDKVGERRYGQLVDRFKQSKQIYQGFQQVTQKFMDVYSFDENRVLAVPLPVSLTQTEMTVNKQKGIEIGAGNFDWAYFVELVSDLKLASDYFTGEVKESLLNMNRLFGLNELEMKEALLPFIDYRTNEIEMNKFKQGILKKYQKVSSKNEPEISRKTMEKEPPTTQGQRRNKLMTQGFNTGEIDIIMLSEEMLPLNFLKDIKEQKNGFVIDEEYWAVKNLVEKSNLSNSVINILIHYVLVATNHENFEKKYASTIGNNWAQSGVNSPEAAIKQVRGFIKQKQEAAEKRKSNQSNYKANYNQKPTRKETLPDWVGKENKETKMSSEEEALFKEQLRQIRMQGKEGE